MTRSPVIIVAALMRLEGATGVQTHMRELHAYLQRMGQAHVVATPFQVLTLPLLAALIALRRFLEWAWKPAAVAVYRCGHAFLLGLRLAWLMRRHPDCVVYAQCPVSASVALRLCRGPAQRVVLVVHFNVSQADEWVGKGMLQRGSWLDRRIRALESEVVQRVHGLVFVSAFMQQQLGQVCPGISAVSSVVIPNFVQPLPDREPLPGMAGRDLISIGTLEPRKNQGYLLQVLAEARRRGRSLSLTLVGDGPHRASLARQVEELGLGEQVHFVGFTPNGRAHIPGHRLYVHAALMESQGIVLLEAMSAGVPVLAAHVGGIPEVFDDGVEGRFWPLDDVARACDILLSLLDDEALCARMGQAALTRFAQRFEASVAAAQLRAYLLERSLAALP